MLVSLYLGHGTNSINLVQGSLSGKSSWNGNQLEASLAFITFENSLNPEFAVLNVSVKKISSVGRLTVDLFDSNLSIFSVAGNHSKVQLKVYVLRP